MLATGVQDGDESLVVSCASPTLLDTGVQDGDENSVVSCPSSTMLDTGVQDGDESSVVGCASPKMPGRVEEEESWWCGAELLSWWLRASE